MLHRALSPSRIGRELRVFQNSRAKVETQQVKPAMKKSWAKARKCRTGLQAGGNFRIPRLQLEPGRSFSKPVTGRAIDEKQNLLPHGVATVEQHAYG